MKRTLLPALLVLAFTTSVYATPISLYTAPDNTYQNTANNPCVFYGPGGSGCNQNPDGWVTVGDTGGGDPFNPNPLVNNYGDMPGELALFGQYVGANFLLGLDINDTSTPQLMTDLTVNFLGVGGVTLASYTFAPATLVPSGSNGVGFADYVLSAGCSGITLNGFCSNYTPFSAPAGTRQINFTFGLAGSGENMYNDGPDKLFLIGLGGSIPPGDDEPPDDDPPPSVPDGGMTMVMLGMSMVGLSVIKNKLM